FDAGIDGHVVSAPDDQQLRRLAGAVGLLVGDDLHGALVTAELCTAASRNPNVAKVLDVAAFGRPRIDTHTVRPAFRGDVERGGGGAAGADVDIGGGLQHRLIRLAVAGLQQFHVGAGGHRLVVVVARVHDERGTTPWRVEITLGRHVQREATVGGHHHA